MNMSWRRSSSSRERERREGIHAACCLPCLGHYQQRQNPSGVRCLLFAFFHLFLSLHEITILLQERGAVRGVRAWPSLSLRLFSVRQSHDKALPSVVFHRRE